MQRPSFPSPEPFRAGVDPSNARALPAVVTAIDIIVSPGTGRSTTAVRPRRSLLTRLYYAVASLQLAIALLCLFTLCLVVATLLEAHYSAAIAQALVYRTWWFSLLLGLLALNVLFAAIKKFPWKKHQTGFLITHAGLLVLLLGGLLTTLGGVDGQMFLIDTDNTDIQNFFSLPNKSDRIQLPGQHQIEVYRLPTTAAHDPAALEALQALDGGRELSPKLLECWPGKHWALSFTPGPFTWYADQHIRPDLPSSLRALCWLAAPRPGFTQALDEQSSLTVKNFYPYTEYWPYSKTDDERGFPVLKLRLTAAAGAGMRPMDKWVAAVPEFEPEPSPVSVRLMVLREPALLPEFLEPPAPEQLGQQGQLVLLVGPQKKSFRIPLNPDRLDKAMDLPGTDLRLTLKGCGDLIDFVPHTSGVDGRQPAPCNPAVSFELSGPDGSGDYLACATLPDVPAFRKGTPPAPVAVWYHSPDFRGGDSRLMGSLQFLQAPDGKVYYRVYGKNGLLQKGRELDVSDPAEPHALPWKPMNLRFQVAAYLPRAAPEPSIVPRDLRPGAEPADPLEPAIRGTLTVGGKTEEFWARLSRTDTRLVVGPDLFFIRYRKDSRPVDFTLTLKRAQQLTDPGTERPASFQSDVVLSYDQDGRPGQKDQAISMNHTLDHGRYKVYQTEYRPLTHPDTLQLVLDPQGQLVSLSGLTVADDPGLYCKYAGSCMLVLGLATMFYMRAYFFKRRAS